MAAKIVNIQVKRGLAASLAGATLLTGEFAYTTDDKKLYIGGADGSKILVNTSMTQEEILEFLGTAAVKDVGVAAGNVPEIGEDGKLPKSIMPPMSITNVWPVESEAAMLALAANPGDIAIRSDENQTYILAEADATVLEHWLKLPCPTDAVISVNGKTGVVTLAKADLGLEKVEDKSSADIVAEAMVQVEAKGYLTAGDVIDGGEF